MAKRSHGKCITEGSEVKLQDGTPGIVRSVQTVPDKSEVIFEVITLGQHYVCFVGESELTCTKPYDLRNYTLEDRRSLVSLAAVCDGLDLDKWSLFSKETEAVEHEKEVLEAWSVHFLNEHAGQRTKQTGDEVTKNECFLKHLQSWREFKGAVRALKKWLNEKKPDSRQAKRLKPN